MTLHNTQVSTQIRGNPPTVKRPRPEPLRDAVRDSLARYFDQLDGTAPNDLYQLVLQQVEQPLFEATLRHTGGNQSKAAQLLGISRSTLRKKLAQYEIE
jgi:Fis family transcriptional regulator